jgi:nucleoside-diphosphate-sugar epimerase
MSQIAVTGADGFLGRATVAAVLRAGHKVIRISRAADGSPNSRGADLRDPVAVIGLLEGAEMVIHLAAAKSGTFHDQYPATVRATQNLLAEAERAGIRRVVLVSSFAVYDYLRVPAHSLVDEETLLDDQGVDRDAYTQTKVLQEHVAREWARSSDCDLVVARPGVVVGPGQWWTYRLGEQFGQFWLLLGNRSQVPLTYVDNCAEAFVHLAVAEGVGGGTYNVFDEAPEQRWYRRQVIARAPGRSFRVAIPWSVAATGVRVLSRWNAHRSAPFRLPGFLTPASLAVRAKPLRYSNERLRRTGWKPALTLDESLSRVFEDDGAPVSLMLDDVST